MVLLYLCKFVEFNDIQKLPCSLWVVLTNTIYFLLIIMDNIYCLIPLHQTALTYT